LEFNSKSLNLGIELENGEIIKEERGDYYQKVETLSDIFVTRFSTVKIFASERGNTNYHKASEDCISIEFPDYIRKDRLTYSI
jgi:hypothetical protein